MKYKSGDNFVAKEDWYENGSAIICKGKTYKVKEIRDYVVVFDGKNNMLIHVLENFVESMFETNNKNDAYDRAMDIV